MHRRDDWATRIETRVRLTATSSELVLEAEQHAFEGPRPAERVASERAWSVRVPRDGV